ELCIHPYGFVYGCTGAIHRPIHGVQAALQAFPDASFGATRQVCIGGDTHALSRRIRHHIEKPWMQHGFAQTLPMQLRQRRKLIDQVTKGLVWHEGGRLARRAVLPELYGAQLATQIALAYGLYLHITWQVRHDGTLHEKAYGLRGPSRFCSFAGVSSRGFRP